MAQCRQKSLPHLCTCWLLSRDSSRDNIEGEGSPADKQAMEKTRHDWDHGVREQTQRQRLTKQVKITLNAVRCAKSPPCTLKAPTYHR